MNYAPSGQYVWDCWYLTKGDEVHAYHLQLPRPTDPPAEQREQPLGHAVSRNLIDWEERPPVLFPDPASPDDDLQHWTGCALWHENKGYLYYTMRHSGSHGLQQKIGLALSDDANNWKHYTGNPLFVPDPRWYATKDNPVPGYVDCRDFHVIKAPQGGWLGYFATRQPGRELPETSVIGCAYSTDLIHWEQRPPVFAPRKYSCVEVPDVFFLNGRWYLMCLVGNFYGNRDLFADPYLKNGTIYAVADGPEGPFHELDDNVLLAGGATTPIAARSISFLGDQFFMYSDRERVDRTDSGRVFFGSLTTPKLLRTTGDYLVAKYSPLIESRVIAETYRSGQRPLIAPEKPWSQLWSMTSGQWEYSDSIRARYDTGWAVQPLDCVEESFIFEALIELSSAVAAGVTLRMNDKIGPEADGLMICLDAKNQYITVADIPLFNNQQNRVAKIQRDQTHHLRIVQRREHIEVYLDDVLKLAFCHYQTIKGGLGLFVDRGEAAFSDVRVRSLRVDQPV